MATYNYTKDADLGLLMTEIQDSSITTTVGGIIPFDNGTIDIIFDSALSTSGSPIEQTILTNLVNAHVKPTPTESVRCVELSFSGNKSPHIEINKTTYVTASRFIFQGSNRVGTVDDINVGVDVDSGTSASIRIYDHTNGNVIGEETGITNTDLQIITIDTISNVPQTQAIFELQVKININKKKVRVHCLTVDFV